MRRPGPGCLELVLLLLLLGFTGLLLVAARLRVNEKANESRCVNNQHQLLIGMLQRWDDRRHLSRPSRHEPGGGVESAAAPERLRTLITEGYVAGAFTLVCPASEDDPLGDEVLGALEPAALPRLLDATWVSYGINRGPASGLGNARSDTPVLADRAVLDPDWRAGRDAPGTRGNHGGKLYVGHADGSVSREDPTASLTAPGAEGGGLGIYDANWPRLATAGWPRPSALQDPLVRALLWPVVLCAVGLLAALSRRRRATLEPEEAPGAPLRDPGQPPDPPGGALPPPA